MNRQDAFALAYLDACLTELRRDPATVLQVSARNRSRAPAICREVRDLLAQGIDSLSKVVLAERPHLPGGLSQDAVRTIRAATARQPAA